MHNREEYEQLSFEGSKTVGFVSIVKISVSVGKAASWFVGLLLIFG